ncbi:MAG TPA: hypothetical protein VF492_10710 [Verrucomicrobiae bacterium]
METKPDRRTARRLSAGLFALSWLTLPAGELSAYRGGDVADADITPPGALDVVDAAATAALQTSRALQIPAVFRNIPAATNVLARGFSRGRRTILLFGKSPLGLTSL